MWSGLVLASLHHTHSLIARKSWQFNEFTILLISSSPDWAVSSERSQGETRHQPPAGHQVSLKSWRKVLGAGVTLGTEMTRRPAQDTSYIKQLARWWPGTWLARWKWICIEPLWCNENIWQIFSHIWTLLLLKCVFLLGTLFSKIKL